MTNKIQVNRSNKHAKIEARDKELLIEKTKTLHAHGYSQVEISKKCLNQFNQRFDDIVRPPIERWRVRQK